MTGSAAAPDKDMTTSAPLQTFAFKLAAVLAGSAAFGLIAAPLLPCPHLISAFLLASGFGFFFVGGTGYRILIAVLLKDAGRHTATSWSGAVAISSLAMLTAWAVLSVSGHDAGLLLAAYAIAINIAYTCVKLSCLKADCCYAKQHIPFWPWHPARPDLRLLEITFTALVLAITCGLLFAAQTPYLSAAIGLGGHLAVRFLSRFARRRLPRAITELSKSGLELAPLSLSLLIISANL